MFNKISRGDPQFHNDIKVPQKDSVILINEWA